MSLSLTALRVLVMAEDLLARAGLAALLAEHPECQVVGQTSDEADISSEVEAANPDVIVWDLGWNSSAILEKLEKLLDIMQPVLMLVPNGDYTSEAWTAGAKGILLRDKDGETLIAALLAIDRGLMVSNPQLAAYPPSARDQGSPPAAETLTPRELEVLRLLAEGLPNKSIAERLLISEHTVKFHVNAIMGKLNAQSRTEAVTRATRMGLILL